MNLHEYEPEASIQNYLQYKQANSYVKLQKAKFHKEGIFHFAEVNMPDREYKWLFIVHRKSSPSLFNSSTEAAECVELGSSLHYRGVLRVFCCTE